MNTHYFGPPAARSVRLHAPESIAPCPEEGSDALPRDDGARPPARRRVRTSLACPFLLIVLSCSGNADAEQVRLPIIGIDHIPTAVANLDEATDAYRRFGFTIKPGRFHANGIRNNHVKFPDGSGVELISPPETPRDPLTAHYIEHLKQGDGPAYLMFHARDTARLAAALDSAGFEYRNNGGGMILDDPALHFLFFGRDNRSPTDRPEHFAHSNSARAMTGIWLALEGARHESLVRLLLALGARRSTESVAVPEPVRAEIFTVRNGRVVVLPERHRIFEARPIIGAEFQVDDIERTVCAADARPGSAAGSVSGDRCLVPPSEAYGLWLEFHEQQSP